MGTDIHGIFQKYDGAKWVDVPSTYEFGRHYQLFAVLAGVRNGFGFAGVPTGEPVVPISEPRGVPEDFEWDGDSHAVSSFELLAPWRRSYYTDGEPLEVWMGDHSLSWLSGEELVSWYNCAPTVIKIGILSKEVYEDWDKVSQPDIYSGWVSGPRIVIVNDNEVERRETPNWTHVRCEWSSSLAEETSYFFDEVKRLMEEHGQVRFVFGFDS